MAKIRVVIADDSSMARGLLRFLIEQEDDIEVIAEAVNGKQAVELAARLLPDVITMDLEMPVMNGLEAIDTIMHNKAIPILVVSSTADAEKSLQAISMGALDLVCKPEYDTDEAREFIQKLRMLSGVSVITRIRAYRSDNVSPITPVVPDVGPEIISGDTNFNKLVLIAASTGGPQALAQILPAIPADFPVPILIGQHIAYGFAQGMADWLNQLCQLPVVLAQHNQITYPGTIYIAPSETDMAISPARKIVLNQSKENSVYHPNCDELLISGVRAFGVDTIGVIISGMGHDGVAGMAAINQAGGITIAQDETSSVVYGMNKIAIEQNHIQHVIPAESIAQAIIDNVMLGKGIH